METNDILHTPSTISSALPPASLPRRSFLHLGVSGLAAGASLREMRFYLGRQPTRISYYIATGRIIVLLTVFTKTKPRERTEIDRARRAMQRCIDEGHLASREEQP